MGLLNFVFMELISDEFFEKYKEKQPLTLSKHFNKLKTKKLAFDFYTTSSAIHSSAIEGNHLDIDTFLKYRDTGVNQRSKSYRQIQDLINAYEFAMGHKITLSNMLKVHKMTTINLLDADDKYQGFIRDVNVNVTDQAKVIYRAPDFSQVESLILELIASVRSILNSKVRDVNHAFYFASMIHLRFAQIHPFIDGNGRIARLLEKWFLSQYLGEKAWYIQSEKLYHRRIRSYYRNINLGDSFENIKISKCIPFLLMLPMALKVQ